MGAGIVRIVTDASFEQDVLRSGRLILVVFGASWCGPCRLLAPALRALAATEKDRLIVAKLDVDASPATADRYGVETFPICILFKAGERDRAARRLYAAAQDRGGASAASGRGLIIIQRRPIRPESMDLGAPRHYVAPAMEFLLDPLRSAERGHRRLHRRARAGGAAASCGADAERRRRRAIGDGGGAGGADRRAALPDGSRAATLADVRVRSRRRPPPSRSMRTA